MGFGYESPRCYPVKANEKVLLLIHLLNCFVHNNVILWLRDDIGLPTILLFAFNMDLRISAFAALCAISHLQNGYGIQIELYNPT